VEKDISELKEGRVELKICERCGGLWLRPAGSRWIYCGPCKAKVDELPSPTAKPSRHVKNKYARRTERVQ
jgi:hypothetical protein